MATASVRAATVAPVAIRNILFATDFSPASNAALPFALALARREGASVFVTHVVASEPNLGVPMDPLPREQNAAHLHAQRELEKLRRSDVLQGVACETILRHGTLCETLGEIVGSRAIDLIVVGTHGRSGVRKLVLGSSAESIFRAAPCPVLTVGPHVSPERLRDGKFQHVLFATDFLSGSLHAWPYAVWLAEKDRARLTLLHALELPPPLTEPNAGPAFTFEEIAAQSRHRLVHLMAATGLNCEVDTMVRGGHPARVVLDVATERKSSIIVMGVHRSRSRLVPHVPWSTADAVACHADCPVLTVRGD
jgi:nucleotide-binding universal stress UspA family protein